MRPEIKEDERERIRKQTEEFLKKGGEIEKVGGFVSYYIPDPQDFKISDKSHEKKEDPDPLVRRYTKLFRKGKDNKEVSDIMGVSLPKVRRWRKKYEKGRRE